MIWFFSLKKFFRSRKRNFLVLKTFKFGFFSQNSSEIWFVHNFFQCISLNLSNFYVFFIIFSVYLVKIDQKFGFYINLVSFWSKFIKCLGFTWTFFSVLVIIDQKFDFYINFSVFCSKFINNLVNRSFFQFFGQNSSENLVFI